VRAGHSNGVEVEILDGLRAGDQVVVYPGDQVTDGTRLHPIKVSER